MFIFPSSDVLLKYLLQPHVLLQADLPRVSRNFKQRAPVRGGLEIGCSVQLPDGKFLVCVQCCEQLLALYLYTLTHICFHFPEKQKAPENN